MTTTEQIDAAIELCKKVMADAPDDNEMSDTDKEILNCFSASLEALRFQKAMQWQPIETAPKDGETEILVGGGDCPYVHINKFILPCSPLKSGAYLSGLGDKQQPTHWMPLPTAELAKQVKED